MGYGEILDLLADLTTIRCAHDPEYSIQWNDCKTRGETRSIRMVAPSLRGTTDKLLHVRYPYSICRPLEWHESSMKPFHDLPILVVASCHFQYIGVSSSINRISCLRNSFCSFLEHVISSCGLPSHVFLDFSEIVFHRAFEVVILTLA